MEIREFKETDLKEVKNFIDRSLKEELSGGQQKLPDNNLNNLRQIYEADKNIFLIVEEEEKIIAVIGVLNESNDVALIRRFFIHRGYRGRNIEDTLLHRVIDFCRIKSYKRILFRSTGRMKAVINLFLKNGFMEKERQNMGEREIVELIYKIKS
ncbi:MAG: GNAT family N-acetyltransferase [Candidatus Omnitrophica bacterium]|nr:GNAT family N-acetyltransferase [Candidatus Omnitrophota bacterium]